MSSIWLYAYNLFRRFCLDDTNSNILNNKRSISSFSVQILSIFTFSRRNRTISENGSGSPKLYPYTPAYLRCSRHRVSQHPFLLGCGTCHTPRNRVGISRLRGHRLAVLLGWSYLSSDTLTLIFQYYILDYIANCDKKPIYNVYHSEDL